MAPEATDEPLQCTKCRLKSVLPDQFRTIRSSNGERKRYCPVCWQKRESELHAAMHWSALAMGILGAIIPAEGLRWPLVVLSLSHFASMLLILPHELSHAFVGWALGFRVYKVQFGWNGRRWWQRRLGRIKVECRGTLDGGLVQAATRSRSWLRAHHILMSAAGPMVHLILIWVMLTVLPTVQSSVWALVLVVGLLANCWNLFWSLLPKTHSIAGIPTASDGLAICSYLFAPSETIRELPLAYYWLETQDRLERRDAIGALQVVREGAERFPNQLFLAVFEGICRLEFDEPLGAREIFLRARESEEMPADGKAMMLNNIAWSDLVSRDPELMKEAQEFSEQAYRALPWTAEIKGTRGSVLVETGEIDAGMKLLQQAFQENERPFNRAINAVFLARGFSRQGRHHEAAAMAERAKSIDPSCSLLRNDQWSVDPRLDQPMHSAAKKVQSKS